MKIGDDQRYRFYEDIGLYTLLLLFFLQLLQDFFEALYGINLANTHMSVSVNWALLFLFSPVVLLFFEDELPDRVLIWVGEAMILARVLEPLLGNGWQVVVAGLGVACFLIVFPAMLLRETPKDSFRKLSYALGTAVALSILFRVLNSGLDITTCSYGQAAGWLLAAFATVGVFRFNPSATGVPAESDKDETPFSFVRLLLLACGLMSVFALIFFVFAAANILTRWTYAPYVFITFFLLFSLSVFSLMLTSTRICSYLLSPILLLAWNIIFVSALVSTILRHQVPLPDHIELYPVLAPHPVWLDHFPLLMLLVSWPILLLDFGWFIQQITALKPSNRALGGGFLLGTVYLAALILAHIFTTVYDYIPIIGPYFRDQFWAVHLAAGLGLIFPSWMSATNGLHDSLPAKTRFWGYAITVIGVITVIAALGVSAKPPITKDAGASTGTPNTLRIFGYNIQQGRHENAERNFDGQLKILMAENPDIIGLSESDTNRIAHGNCDVVRYFADNLNMYSYYGPSPITGTFGVALLSKYPIQNPCTYFLYSHDAGFHEKEQTAVLVAEIVKGGKTFTVAVTHLGNSGPVSQQKGILEKLAGKENVILMGDFNFRPDSDSYHLTVQTLYDSFQVRMDDVSTPYEVDPRDRIDHIFVTPGTAIKECRYLPGPDSDHPAMLTEIAW